ncbi:hypothetical protein [uncultured Parabacteroides sp.]|uniref:tetratricopeptide repeat protein n=1 Tax=uncultured Parabacteroides sp. TaxID=512312 RepID=UPI0025FFA448|nr:hypothetical protein [uncultured Parabacteroides sp.]
MKRHIHLILFLFIVSLTACQKQSHILPLLQEAETLMGSQPDSSLCLLESVQSPEKLSTEEYATWCLLVTQARDKKYVKHTSDSVIGVAVRYFEKQNDPLRYAKALYYKGRVFQDQGKTEEATELFVKALDLGKDCQDYNLLFLISSRLGTLYGYQDLAKALKFYQKAYQYAIQSGDSSCLSYAYSYMGRAYGMQKDWNNAIESYKKGEEIALAINNKSALSLSLSECATIYKQIRSFEKAKGCMDRVATTVSDENIKGKTKIYLGIGDLYRLMKQYDSAAVYLQKALLYDNLYTKRSVYQCFYYLYEEQQEYKKAVEYNNLYWAYVDSINKMTNKEAILAVEARYNYEQYMLEKEMRTQKILSLVAVFLLLLLCIVIVYQRRLLKKDKEIQSIRKELNCFIEESEQNKKSIDQNQQKINDLTSQLEEKKQKMADTTQLKVEKEKLEEENRNLKQRNGKLQKEIQSKFILLSQRDEEFAIYKQKMEKREADPNILVRLNKEKTLLQEDDWEELRIMVNVISPDFTHHLLDSCPKLSESDVRFCSLIKLGYTLPDLCILLGVQEEAVAKRKSRIKKRIDEGKKWKKGEFDAYLKSF